MANAQDKYSEDIVDDRIKSMNTAQNGKGDAPRPYNPSRFADNYETIFRQKVKQVCDLIDECECLKTPNDHDTRSNPENSNCQGK